MAWDLKKTKKTITITTTYKESLASTLVNFFQVSDDDDVGLTPPSWIHVNQKEKKKGGFYNNANQDIHTNPFLD